MSKKVAVASIVALILGGVTIPGGIMINSFIADMTYGYVNEGLLAVKEQGTELAIPMMKQYGVAVGMQMIWDEAMPLVEELVNCTFIAYCINLSLTGLIEEMTDPVPAEINVSAGTPEEFFNDVNYEFDIDAYSNFLNLNLTIDIEEIDGAAKYHNASLGINASAQQMLLYGNHTDDPYSPYYIPGLIYDIDTGFGVLDFLALYNNVNTTEEQDAMVALYKCNNWSQIVQIEEYMIDYLKEEMIPIVLAGVDVVLPPETPQWLIDLIEFFDIDIHVNILELIEPMVADCTTANEVAEKLFMMQWTNCSLLDEAIDFHLVDEKIPEHTYGFELLPPYESGVSLESALMLWDRNEEKALANLTHGIDLWIQAQDDSEMYVELRDHFGLNDDTMDIILDWLWAPGNFSDYTLPYLVESPFGFNMSMETLTFHLLLGQWANNTIFGEQIFPDEGFPIPLSAGEKYGFEINVNEPSNITLDSALSLWDETSDYSLLSDTGLNNWLFVVAHNDPTSDLYIVLRDENDLTDRQLNLILEWIPRFQMELMPFLAQEALGLPMDSITLGATIQLSMIAIGGVLIGLASTGFIGNRVIKVQKSEMAALKAGFPNRKKILPQSSQYKRVWNNEFGHYEYKKK